MCRGNSPPYRVHENCRNSFSPQFPRRLVTCCTCSNAFFVVTERDFENETGVKSSCSTFSWPEHTCEASTCLHDLDRGPSYPAPTCWNKKIDVLVLSKTLKDKFRWTPRRSYRRGPPLRGVGRRSLLKTLQLTAVAMNNTTTTTTPSSSSTCPNPSPRPPRQLT